MIVNDSEPLEPVDAMLLVDVQAGFVSGPHAVPAALAARAAEWALGDEIELPLTSGDVVFRSTRG